MRHNPDAAGGTGTVMSAIHAHGGRVRKADDGRAAGAAHVPHWYPGLMPEIEGGIVSLVRPV